MRKGEQTRSLILGQAVSLASRIGLEGLSIGSLAARLNLSKSGLFAHFGSKEDLQLQTLKQVQLRFEDAVFRPALKVPPGLPRLRAVFSNWLDWLERGDKQRGGCLILAASMEYDDRPGAVRDLLLAGQRELRGALTKMIRLAVDEGHLKSDTDPWQVTFELFGIVLAAHHNQRLLGDPRALERARSAFDRLVALRGAA